VQQARLPEAGDPVTAALPPDVRLLATVSTRLMRASIAGVDAAVVGALGALAEAVGAARASVVPRPDAELPDGELPAAELPTAGHHWYPTGDLGAGDEPTGPAPEAWQLLDRDEPVYSASPTGVTVALPMRVRGRSEAAILLELPPATTTPLDATLTDRLRAAAGLIGAALDRRARLSRLEASERRYRSILEDLGSVIVTLDEHDRVTYLNPAWSRLTGLPAEELLGTELLARVHPDDRAALAGYLAQARSGGSAEAPTARFRCADGQERWLEVSARAYREEPGTPAGISAIMHDVTARREAELRSHEALDRAERARERADQASRAKSEFLSRMSHELRTPLNAVLGFAQLLELGSLAGEDADNLEHILHAGRHLLALVDESLDVARIEAGRLTISLEPVLLTPVITESLDLVRPVASANMVTLAGPEPAAGQFWVRADRQRLKQVLVNLLSNAIKYNHPGGRVTVECAPAEPAVEAAAQVAAAEPTTPTVGIVVRDTGTGIPADRLDQVFLPFERLGAATTQIEGTGLGLAVTKRLVEAMHGTIGVASVEGVGSTFRVDLPADPNAAAEHGQAAAEPPTPPVVTTWTALYIEDNASNVTLVQRIVTRRPDVRLLTATDAGSGLAMLRRHRPDLVLLDLHLPDRHGAEVLAEIRDDPDLAIRMTPVVVVTADLSAGTEQRLRDGGANGFVPKPVEVPLMLATIDRFLPP
jgi:PAS domain S-box-containing protein